MRIFAILCVLLLTGCLTSKEALITTGDFPLPAGTSLAGYNLKDGKFVQVAGNQSCTLEIVQAWYVMCQQEPKDSVVFRLKRVDRSNWLAVFKTNGSFGIPKLTYGWVRRSDKLFVVYGFEGKTFAEWATNSGMRSGWQKVNSNVEISSLGLLERSLPRMIEAGLAITQTAYRVIDSPDAVEKNLDALLRRHDALIRSNKSNEAMEKSFEAMKESDEAAKKKLEELESE